MLLASIRSVCAVVYVVEKLKKFISDISVPVGILGVLFTVFSYYYSPSVKISIGWGLFVLFFPLSLLYVMLVWLCDEREKAKIALPRVIKSIEHGHGLKVPTLLVSGSQLLGQNLAVSIYTIRDGFELLLGQGCVAVVQGDGLAQIAVLDTVEGHEQTWKDIYENNSDVLKRTLVRPGQQIEI